MTRHQGTLSLLFAGGLLCSASTVFAQEQMEPAKCPAETVRAAPGFPAVCMAIPGDKHQVTVRYDVDEAGKPVNVEAIDYSDACFVEVTKTSVAAWRFACDQAGAKGKETIIHFKKNDPEAATKGAVELPTHGGDKPITIEIITEKEANARRKEADCAAGDVVRIPPRFPKKCMRYGGKNSVKLRFDIDGEGVPYNIEVIEYTNNCFVGEAKKSVSKWRYQCDGVGKEDIETVVTFYRE